MKQTVTHLLMSISKLSHYQNLCQLKDQEIII